MTSDRRGSEIVYRVADDRDDREIRSLLRENAMDSWVAATVRRDPSWFASCGQMGRSVSIVARKAETPYTLIGLCNCDFFPVHMNGGAGTACYLGSLRIAQSHRHQVRILKDGFRSIPELAPDVEGRVLFTSIAAENMPARRLLEAGLPGMPRYRFLAEMHTFAVSVRRGRHRGLLERAGIEDVPELAAFHNEAMSGVQFSPVLDEEWLRRALRDNALDFLVRRGKRSGGIEACIAVWDQRAFRQIVIDGYRAPLNRLRVLYNLWASLTRGQELPPSGHRLEQVFLAFMALRPDAYSEAAPIVEDALFHAKNTGARTALLGVSPSSPLYADLRSSLGPRIYRTRIESVTLRPDSDPTPLFDQNAVVQPEVALL